VPEEYITRREFDQFVRRIDDYGRDLELQFKRIAQIQAELDHIRAAWSRRKGGAR
jgi:hypothetical protein